MTHFLVMLLFAAMVALVFGIVGRETTTARLRYGTKIFLEFMAVGLGLAWLLYFLPG